MREFIIGTDASDQRFDRYISKLLPNAKKGEIQKWIRTKVITLNLKRADASVHVKNDDVIRIFLPDSLIDSLCERELIDAMDANLEIIYEDEDILIVNKPKDLLTHPDSTEFKNTLSTRVQYYLKHLSTATFSPASVNRLDKNTSGLVLFCKTYDSLKIYNEMMRNREINKKYSAIVEGEIKEKVEIHAYLEKDEDINKVKLSRTPKEGYKEIYTIVEPIEVSNGFSYVSVDLITGRTHQIRASLSMIGHPIVGDVKYGGQKFRGITNQLLHAYHLELGGRVFEKKSEKMESIWNTIKK